MTTAAAPRNHIRHVRQRLPGPLGPDAVPLGDRLLHVAHAEADAEDEAAGDLGQVEDARHLGGRRRRRRDPRRTARGRRLPLRPEALQAARRQGPAGHPSARAARHRQDAAREGGGPRIGRDVPQPIGLVVHRDVRRPRRRPHPPPVLRGPRKRTGDHLHRRARRRRRDPRRRHLGRARPDTEPAAGRDGRLRLAGQRRRHGGLEPAGEARQGTAAPGPLRPPGVRAAARLPRPGRDPQGAHAQQAARARRSRSNASPATARA